MGTPTSAKAKKTKKRKRVSKHILEARQKQQESAAPGESLGAVSPASGPKKSKNRNRNVKDPAEAALYLKQWQESREGTTESLWKFHKNTQSWLIRHMYDASKVSKSTFEILVAYLQAMPPPKFVTRGGSIKERIRQDATRRVVRYKDHEANKPNDDGEANNKGEEDEEVAEGDGNKQPIAPEGNEDDDGEEDNDDVRWLRKSDHEKRKEYKRARKVLESLSE